MRKLTMLLFLVSALSTTLLFAKKPHEDYAIPDNAIKYEASIGPGGLLQEIRNGKKFNFYKGDGFNFEVNGKIVGKHVHYSSGGLGHETLFKNGKKHGKEKFYYPDGKPFWIKTYNLGLLDGPCRYWSKDGKLMGESMMRKGTGVLKEYRPDGSFDRITHYMHGVRHGQYTEWGNFTGDDHSAYDTVYYENGKSEGWWRTYTSDGALIKESMHKNGKPHGVYRKWNRAGVLINDTPEYYINFKEATKEELEKAAKTDRILYRSLHSISNRPQKK